MEKQREIADGFVLVILLVLDALGLIEKKNETPWRYKK